MNLLTSGWLAIDVVGVRVSEHALRIKVTRLLMTLMSHMREDTRVTMRFGF